MSSAYNRSWMSRSRDKSGYYQGTVHTGWKPNGQPEFKHRQRKNKKELRAVLESLERVRDEGDLLASERPPTLAKWLDQWLEDEVVPSLRTRTAESYESIIRRHLKPRLGAYTLDRLREEHISGMYRDLLADGLAPSTVNRIHAVLSGALRLAHDRQRIKRNYCRHVKPPQIVAKRQPNPLSKEEFNLVMRAVDDTRNGVRWVLAVTTALRQSEVLGLSWDDVDLDAGLIRVTRGLHRIKGGLEFEEPKSPRSRREVPLPPALVPRLRAHREAQARDRAQAGSEWQDTGLVFVQANGQPLDRRADHRAWQRLLASLDLPARTIHDLRHTAATFLLEGDVPVRVVSELLGHAQTRLTEDTYMKVRPSLAQRAATAMDAVLVG